MVDVQGIVGDNPIIPALRSEEDIASAVACDVNTIFLLHADIFNLPRMVNQVRDAGKTVFVHMDFLEGIGRDPRAIDYLAEVIKPHGILTTKSSHIKHAKARKLFTIQRFFLVDSQSYDTMIKTVKAMEPNMIEVMPGVMPHVIAKICKNVAVPVIAGGLIEHKHEIIEVLKAGAVGVSTGKKALWML